MQVGGTSVESLESYGTFTVSGDTHGQFFDFIRIFSNDIGGGLPSRSNRFLFNGDMVDRGKEIFSYYKQTNTIYIIFSIAHNIHLLNFVPYESL